MRRVGLVIAVLLILPAASSGEGDSVDAPHLIPGDFWTYETNTSLESGLTLDGRITLALKEHAPVVVEGTSYDAYILSVSGTGALAGTFDVLPGSPSASGSWLVTAQEIVETRGLKRISTVLDLEASGTLHTQPPVPFRLRVQNTTTYRVLDDGWQFPLRVGSTSVVASRMNFTEDVSSGGPTTPDRTTGFAWWNVTYHLEGPDGIETPAGRFDAFPISATYPNGLQTRGYYAPSAGHFVRTETRNETSQVGSTELVAYRYQALEPSAFLGLTLEQWALGAVGGAAGIAGILWWWRRKLRRSEEAAILPPPP